MITPRKLNTYIIFKLPSAFLCGVRTQFINSEKCIVTVKHRWINQNPFKSMFWAVQGMAAEFATGASSRVGKYFREAIHAMSPTPMFTRTAR